MSRSTTTGRLRISIPAAGFEFEATGTEENVSDWAKSAMETAFGPKAVETREQRLIRLMDECDRRNEEANE